jgi:hypothetical protein
MTTWTPLHTLIKVCHELGWWTNMLSTARIQLDEDSESRIEVYEVQKVLRAMTVELERIIRVEKSKLPNRRNIRPGADLALKAQLAKARWTELSEAEKRQREQSHK